MRAASLLAVAAVFLAAAVPANAQVRRAAQVPQQRVMTIDNAASCDLSNTPSATLLLPYFEVELQKKVTAAANTIFTVINTSPTSQIARVTLWTDYGYPAIWFNVYLSPYDVQAISLWDVISLGRVPQSSNSGRKDNNPNHISLESCASNGGDLPPDVLAGLQAMLTTGVKGGGDGECRVGGTHAMAIGYATVDVVNSCTMLSPLDIAYYSQVLLYDNVLTGDYERINADPATGNYAGGNPLVHIKAVPEGGAAGTGTTPLPYTFYDRFTPTGGRKIDRRQPLPSVFAARYIQGGTATFQTDYAIWREGSAVSASACTSSAKASMPFVSFVRFDESENATVNVGDASAQGQGALVLPSTSAPPTASLLFPPLNGYSVSGWMYLNLDNRVGTTASGTNVYSSARPSQNWVIVHMRAEGRYGVDYDATTLGNGCTTNGPQLMQVPQVQTRILQ